MNDLRPSPPSDLAATLASVEALAELTGAALIAVGRAGRVRAWSAAAAALTGIAREDAVGASLDQLDRDAGRAGKRVREAVSAGAPRIEVGLGLAAGPRRDGRFRLRLRRVEAADGPLLVGRLEARPEVDSDADDAGIVAVSRVMQEVLRRLRRAAESQVTTLIRGESGTGKELAARAIHRWSPRADGPFVAINCAALSPTLLEAELFGHVRGAFTGAEADRPGVFVEADGGTLFLDEIGEVPPEVQVKLLRALQEREVRPVGSERARPVDVRLVTATNRDLERGLADGSLREDFFYRIRVFEIVLPPLRERREDVLPIARALLARIGREHGREGLRLGEEAERVLLAHSWPGNVRELANALEHAAVLSEGVEIGPEALPTELRPERRRGAAPIGALGLEAGSDAERDRILRALEAHDWNRTATAVALGISRVTLWKKIRAFRLDEGIFRDGSRPRRGG